MIFKRDDLKLGIILGILGPALGLVVIYFLNYSAFSFGEFLDLFLNTNRLITSIGSLSLLANVILFTLYVNTHRDKTAKGIFIVTLIFWDRYSVIENPELDFSPQRNKAHIDPQRSPLLRVRFRQRRRSEAKQTPLWVYVCFVSLW